MLYILVELLTLKYPKAPCRPAVKSHAMQSTLDMGEGSWPANSTAVHRVDAY